MKNGSIFLLQKILKNKNIRIWLWFSLTTLLLSLFIVLSSEMLEASSGRPELIGTIDQFAIHLLPKIRSPKLNSIFINLTALGSTTVILIVIFFTSVLLFFKRRMFSILHILTAGLGSAILTLTLKSYFERPRPTVLIRLVNVQGFSYPSGHSLSSAALYFTFAIVLCQSFKKSSERITILFLSVIFIFLIALSRVYLGVHYMSDVMAGVLLGISWASLLGAVTTYLQSESN